MSGTRFMTNPPKYQERLWPNFYVWLFAILMLAALAIAAGNVYGYDTAVLIFAGSVIALIVAVLTATAGITVTPTGLRAGRAHLPMEFIGDVKVLDKQQTARARAQDAHPHAFFMIRSWIPESVIVVVTDESDPHPYWHLSSRNSRKLKNALDSLHTN